MGGMKPRPGDGPSKRVTKEGAGLVMRRSVGGRWSTSGGEVGRKEASDRVTVKADFRASAIGTKATYRCVTVDRAHLYPWLHCGQPSPRCPPSVARLGRVSAAATGARTFVMLDHDGNQDTSPALDRGN